MRYASYRDITGPDGLLANCLDFKGNTMQAKWDYDTDYYYVYSYRTCIAYYELNTYEWFVKDEKYSTTTSRHQNYCRARLALNFTRSITMPNGETRIYPEDVMYHPLDIVKVLIGYSTQVKLLVIPTYQ